MAGTPVKSCSSTLAGTKAISWLGWAAGSQSTSAATSSAVTKSSESWRSRFSSSSLSE